MAGNDASGPIHIANEQMPSTSDATANPLTVADSEGR